MYFLKPFEGRSSVRCKPKIDVDIYRVSLGFQRPTYGTPVPGTGRIASRGPTWYLLEVELPYARFMDIFY